MLPRSSLINTTSLNTIEPGTCKEPSEFPLPAADEEVDNCSSLAQTANQTSTGSESEKETIAGSVTEGTQVGNTCYFILSYM